MPILRDTGCNVSCIHETHKHITSNISDDFVTLTSANNTIKNISGKAAISFTIHKTWYVQKQFI